MFSNFVFLQILDVMKVVYDRTGKAYVIFGDSAFPLNRHMQRMLKGRLDERSRRFNALMARYRICIENVSAEIFQFWGYTSHHLGLKLGSQNVGEIFLVAAFLQNCKSCFRWSQMASQYGYSGLLQMPLQRFLSVRNIPLYCGIV